MLKDLELRDLELYIQLEKRNTHYAKCVDNVSTSIRSILEGISSVFKTYTKHDIQHSYRVIKYMSDFVDDINEISEIDIMLLIFSGLFHDIGMYADEEEIEIIKEMKTITGKTTYKSIYRVLKNETLAIQEYLRIGHASRSSEFIKNNRDLFLGIFEDRQVQCNRFVNILAEICKSHEMDFEWITKNLSIEDVIGGCCFNKQYISMLLRLSDLLDIDEFRAPLDDYMSLELNETGDLEWLQHHIISNDEKVGFYDNKFEKTVTFYGECSDPKIHRKMLKYIKNMEKEIGNCKVHAKKFEKPYLISINSLVKNRIETKGFTESELRFNLDYSSITKLLMGENIYGGNKYGLRELIQNSIDACLLKKEIVDEENDYCNTFNPRIAVILDKENNTVVIKDNGIGMDYDIIWNYFLNVGVSYYKTYHYQYLSMNYEPIGQFGIGFLACFMLSNQIKVITKRHNCTIKYTVYLDKSNEFISLNDEVSANESFTEIHLNYDSFIKAFNNKIEDVVAFLEETFIADNVNIIVGEGEYKKEIVNPLYNKNLLHEKIIDVSMYDNCLEGQIILRNIDSPFIENILDFPFKGLPVYYDRYLDEIYELDFLLEGVWNESDDYDNDEFIDSEDEEENLMTEKHRITKIIDNYFPEGELDRIFNEAKKNGLEADYIENEIIRGMFKDGVIYWYDFPLINDDIATEFYKHYKAGKNLNETIKLYRNSVNWLSVVVDTKIDYNKLKKNINRLAQHYGHIRYDTNLELFKQEVNACIINDTIIAFSNTDGKYYNNRKAIDSKTFVKGILLHKAMVVPNLLINNCSIESIKINILRGVGVNVARNDLDKTSLSLIDETIGEIVVKWLINKEKNQERKEILQIFLDNNFVQ